MQKLMRSREPRTSKISAHDLAYVASVKSHGDRCPVLPTAPMLLHLSSSSSVFSDLPGMRICSSGFAPFEMFPAAPPS
jgi:hypothetical protein